MINDIFNNRYVAALTTLLCCVIFFPPVASFVITAALIGISYGIRYLVNGWNEQIELANRRDCIVICEAWYEDGSPGPELPPIFDGLYEYQSAGMVETIAQGWEFDLIEAGNASLLTDLDPDLILPILTIYNRKGSDRMETREQYGKRIAKLITTKNKAYHAALELENEGENYIADYILRR